MGIDCFASAEAAYNVRRFRNVGTAEDQLYMWAELDMLASVSCLEL